MMYYTTTFLYLYLLILSASSHSRFYQQSTSPSLAVFDEFFNDTEIHALHQLAFSLKGENAWYTPKQLLSQATQQPAFEWIHDIVMQHAGAGVKVVEIWAQYWSGGIEWHTDKDEELYHRNRVLHAPEKSFVVYVKYGRPETRGLLICSNQKNDRYCSQYDRFSPVRGRLVVFDPGLPHRAEMPPDEQVKSAFNGANCPGPIHQDEEEQRGWRSILFNAWTKHMPEAILNESSRNVTLISRRGGWTATGPFNDGPSAENAGKLGKHLRRNGQRRLRPGSFGSSLSRLMTKDTIDATVDVYISRTVGSPHKRQRALFLAARLGASMTVRKLLQSNTFVDYVCKDGTDAALTPLHAASMSGDVETVRTILAYGAGVQGVLTTFDRDGRSALHLSVVALVNAAKRNATRLTLTKYRKVVDVLAQAGSHADPFTRQLLLRYWGSVHQHEEEATEQLHLPKETARNLVEDMCEAAANGDDQAVDKLLTESEDKQMLLESLCQKYGQWNALRVAACNSRGNVVELLLKHGADPNVFQLHLESDEETSTHPIHCAAMRGDVWSVLALLSNGVDVHKTDRWGRTPLHLASEQIQPPKRVNSNPPIAAYQHVISALLSHNATVDVVGYSKIIPSDGTTLHNLLRAGVNLP